ncbi:hypothetical protein AZI87_02090 [Bdellovibrio bacteriovorus]|uniref:DSBA-like thioredoxin domain-containing protein n=1 Tax=Bdellovibrio bacteriovorus TaxID=959 RepID=A0A161PTH6_BDEBC|nr:DsbA family oxidoreductase [Bdellovibrio bacteriovorus]KYG68076.1 hypothetical protein AZI87_02090 [Bdellovibrio bacteriovorus]
MKKKIVVELVVDIVCPWCYVGKKNFLDAVAERKDIDIEVKVLPFQLDPASPQEGVPRKEYLRNKFGNDENFKAAEARLLGAAEKSGLKMNMEKIKTHINTLDCHRLIWWAGKKGKQLDVTNALYAAYYEEGLDLSKIENLQKALSPIGFKPEEVSEFLKSDQGREEVGALIGEAYDLGISGVPFFIFDRQIGVSGAQPKEVFLQVFQDPALQGEE